jgi:hypothetical protein
MKCVVNNKQELFIDQTNKEFNNVKSCINNKKSFSLIQNISRFYWYKNIISAITIKDILAFVYNSCDFHDSYRLDTYTKTIAFKYSNIENANEYTNYLEDLLRNGSLGMMDIIDI